MGKNRPTEPSRRHFMATSSVLGAGLLAASHLQAADVPLAPPDKQPPDLKVPKPVKRKIGYAIVGLVNSRSKK